MVNDEGFMSYMKYTTSLKLTVNAPEIVDERSLLKQWSFPKDHLFNGLRAPRDIDYITSHSIHMVHKVCKMQPQDIFVRSCFRHVFTDIFSPSSFQAEEFHLELGRFPT